MYSANGRPVLGGLHDRNVYTLLDGGGTGQIRLGSLFNTTAVDAANDTISFTSGHGYRSGDCIWYDPRGGASIIGGGEPANSGGCSSNSPPTPGAQAFFVRVIDATTIALTTTQAAALAGTDAPTLITPIDDTHVKVSSDSNIAVGDRVVYRAPVSVPFTSALVNVTLSNRDVNGTSYTVPATNPDGSTAHNPDAYNIFVGSTFYAELNDGDALTYTLKDPAGGMGLVSGTTYYAIKTGDGYTIRLAASYCEAVGSGPGCAPFVCRAGPDPDGTGQRSTSARPQSRPTGRRARLLRHELQPRQQGYHARHHAWRAGAHPGPHPPTR